MTDYDPIDPDSYLARFDRFPRERYLVRHWRPAILNAIERYCHGKSVLDLGCGFGDYTTAIHGVDHVVGVDLSTRWLGYAHRVNGVAEVVRADAETLPFEAGSFDAILSVGLVEHVTASRLVSEIARVLRPGGFVVVMSANRWSAFRVVHRMLLRVTRHQYELQEISLSDLDNLMRTMHMRIVEQRASDGLIWLPDALDRLIGIWVYATIDRIAAMFGHNPFSNGFLAVAERLQD